MIDCVQITDWRHGDDLLYHGLFTDFHITFKSLTGWLLVTDY